MKKLNKKILSDVTNKKIFAYAKDSSIKLYLVGGYLRDLFIKVEKADRDFVVEGHRARNLAKKLASFLKGHFVDLDQERDIARVVLGTKTFDFSGTSGKNLEEDLKRRDFTINSIAWSPQSGFIDPLNGIKDIRKGLIKAVSKENMLEDPIRLIRAYRIASEFKNFAIEPATADIITKLAYLIPAVSMERVSYELFKILESPQSFSYLYNASQSRILEAVFPELIPAKHIRSNERSFLKTVGHSLDLINFIEVITPQLPNWVIMHLKEVVSSGVSRLSILKLAGLLHEIGKPLKWVIAHNGEHSFHGYEVVGADLVDQISNRLKFSKRITHVLHTLIKSQSLPYGLVESCHLEKKSLYRFFSSFGDDCILLVVLAMADMLNKVKREGPLRVNKQLFLQLLKEYRYFKIKETQISNFINGDDIIKAIDIAPGPNLGRIIYILKEAWFLKEVRSKRDALEYLRKLSHKISHNIPYRTLHGRILF